MNVNLQINGKTEVYGLIGDPVSHTFSPPIHNTLAKNFNQNFVYVPFHVHEGNVKSALCGAHALGIKGLNVTVPHKKTVMEHLCGIEKRAEAIGAVNTLKYTENGYFGYNTDILGILYSLQTRGITIKNKDVLIIGAGGSACAALVLAASEGAKSVVVANRTVENAEKLKNHVLNYYPANITVCSLEKINEIPKCDIVIQTTTVGFGNNTGLSPIPNNRFFAEKNVSAAFDTIYIPSKTKFLEDAESMGVTAINGFDMLIYQAVAASEIWLDKNYDNKTKENLKKSLWEASNFK